MLVFKKRCILVTLVGVMLLIGSLEAQSDFEPKLILEMFRHGSRTTPHNYLNEPYYEHIKGDQLFANGMRQHLLLGKQVRADYKTLFEGSQSQFHAKMYASTSARCVLSAQSHFLGLYPLGTGSKITTTVAESINPPYKAQTPPVLQPTDDWALENGFWPEVMETFDHKFPGKKMTNCPKFDQNRIDAQNPEKNPILRKVNEELKISFVKMAQELTARGYSSEKIFGEKVYNLFLFAKIQDAFASHKAHEGTFPPNIDKDIFYELSLFTGIGESIIFQETHYYKVATTEFAQDILTKMQKKIKDIKSNFSLRYMGYSGHDTNLFPMLVALKATSFECLMELQKTGHTDAKICSFNPPYASNIIFELATREEEFYVKVLFNGEHVDFCSGPVVVADKGYCPFQKFFDLFKERAILNEIEGYCSKKVLKQEAVAHGVSHKRLIYFAVFWLILGLIGLIFHGIEKGVFKKSKRTNLEQSDSLENQMVESH